MDKILTDDHVAEMLAKEAKDYSLRYSSVVLDAGRSSRPTTKAKPNTRFLRNIIKETTNHNQALLAKEAAEAQARLENLAETKAKEERKHRPGAQDLRRRQLGAITATLQGKGKKRKVAGEEGVESESPASKRAATELYTPRDRSARQEKSARESTDRRETREPERDRHRARDRDRETERRPRKPDRSASPERGDSCSRKERRRDRSRSRSPGPRDRKERHKHRHSHHYRERSRSEDESAPEKRPSSHRKHRSDRHRRHDREEDAAQPSSSSRHHHKHRSREAQEEPLEPSKTKEYDSDPLEEIIGPLLPPSPPRIRIKGRGAAMGPSAMDSRFSESYDPKSDIQPDSDVEAGGDDWADSLEALRDREKWRRQGPERLRAAGFSEEQIRGWEEKGGKERGVEDVRWAGRGEGREWDRGKTVGGVDGADEVGGEEGDEMVGRLGWER